MVVVSATLLLGLLCSMSAFAQTTGSAPAIESQSAQWSLLLDQVTEELDKPEIDHANVEALRPQIERLPRDAAAAERAALDERLVEREGHLKQAELITTRARQVMARITELRRERSARRLLERGPSPLSWAVLGSAGPHALDVVARLLDVPSDEWLPSLGETRWYDWPSLLAVAFALTLGLVLPARRWMLRRYARDRSIQDPPFPHRLQAAVLVAIARGVLPSFIGAVPVAFLLTAPIERGVAADLLFAVFGALAGIFLAGGLARAALAPYSPDGWRLAPLAAGSAQGLYHRMLALAWLVGTLSGVEYVAERHLEAPRELAVFYRLLADGAVAGFVLLLLPGHLWRRRESARRGVADEPAAARPSRLGQVLRIAAAIAALSIPILSVAGFEPLATYLATNLVETAIILGLAAIAHGVARDSITLLLARRGEGTEAAPAPGDDEREMLKFWLVVAIDTLIVAVAAVALAASWGFAWADIKGGLTAALEGFRIGSFRLSITDLFFAIIVFIALLTATRWLQRLLEIRVFPQTRLDAGMRNSLKSTVGYVGLIVAVAAAISTAGIDLSNIAIIAGALSIGIGFGLQNIVNNFVSGLILLAERPIKIGDWIVIGEHQGLVKRINVRATEIQTFHRSSVIIPNSELLSSSLVNWTHKDAMARVRIPVGVSYGADVELVRSTLLEIAAAHPEVARDPEPWVFFMAFGESSLDFELRCYITEAPRVRRIETGLRFEIVRLFRERGIEIPFPQRDVYLRRSDEMSN